MSCRLRVEPASLVLVALNPPRTLITFRILSVLVKLTFSILYSAKEGRSGTSEVDQ